MRNHLFILLFIFLHLFSKAQNSCCAKAIVKNAATKEVVPFCLVGIYDAGFTCAGNGTSDFDGTVKIEHLLPGKYFVIANYDGFVNDTTAIDLYGEQIMQIAINLKPIPVASTDSIIISYKSPDEPRSSAIKGVVKERKTDEAIPFCNVLLEDTSFHICNNSKTQTDIEGNFSFTKLKAGKYFVIVQYVGYRYDTTEVNLKESETKLISLRLEENYVPGNNSFREPLIDPEYGDGTVSREEYSKIFNAADSAASKKTNASPEKKDSVHFIPHSSLSLRPMKRPIRVLVAKVGLDGHDRGAKVIASFLRDAGMEVIYTGLRQTPEMVVNAALQEDVDVIGVSILSGAHMTVFPKIMTLMKEKKLDDVLLTGGGIIPDADMKKLNEMGVGQLFPPGTDTKTIVDYITTFVKEHREI